MSCTPAKQGHGFHHAPEAHDSSSCVQNLLRIRSWLRWWAPVGNAQRCPQGSRSGQAAMRRVSFSCSRKSSMFSSGALPASSHASRPRGRGDPPQAALAVRKDPHHVGRSLDLLVQALQEIGRLEVFVVRARQPVEGERLLDMFFDPDAELGVIACHLVSQAARSRRASVRSRRS